MPLSRSALALKLAACAPLVLVAPAFAQQDATPPTSAGNLSDPASLVSAALDKIGSVEQREAVKSMTITGDMEFTEEDAPEVESLTGHLLLPDQFHLVVSLADGETVIATFDGNHGWDREPGELDYSIMPEGGERMFTLVLPHGLLLSLFDGYPVRTANESIEIDGVKHHHLSLQSSEDAKPIELFINAESGQIGAIEAATPEGIPARLTITAWTESDGLTLPSNARFEIGMGEEGREVNFTYSEVTLNEVDQAVFKMPPDVERQIGHEGDGGDGGQTTAAPGECTT